MIKQKVEGKAIKERRELLFVLQSKIIAELTKDQHNYIKRV